MAVIWITQDKNGKKKTRRITDPKFIIDEPGILKVGKRRFLEIVIKDKVRGRQEQHRRVNT